MAGARGTVATGPPSTSSQYTACSTFRLPPDACRCAGGRGPSSTPTNRNAPGRAPSAAVALGPMGDVADGQHAGLPGFCASATVGWNTVAAYCCQLPRHPDLDEAALPLPHVSARRGNGIKRRGWSGYNDSGLAWAENAHEEGFQRPLGRIGGAHVLNVHPRLGAVGEALWRAGDSRDGGGESRRIRRPAGWALAFGGRARAREAAVKPTKTPQSIRFHALGSLATMAAPWPTHCLPGSAAGYSRSRSTAP